MSAAGVVLDACVLVPAPLCDFLLRAAAAEMYQPYWSADILEEVLRTLVGDLGRSLTLAQRRIEAMKTAFPEALVTHHTPLIAAMTNDPKDRHVLACAVATGAEVIVTSNVRDFPASALLPFGIEAQTPDAFLTYLLDCDTELVAGIPTRQAAALRAPPKTVEDIIRTLASHAPGFASRVELNMAGN